MCPKDLATHERWGATNPSESQDPYSLAVLASVYGLEGRNDEATPLIEQFEETARHHYVSASFSPKPTWSPPTRPGNRLARTGLRRAGPMDGLCELLPAFGYLAL